MTDEPSEEDEFQQMMTLGQAELVMEWMDGWIDDILNDEMTEEDLDYVVTRMASHPNTASTFMHVLISRLIIEHEE